MAKIAIKVKNLSKEYFLSQDGKYYNLRDLIADIPKKILNRPEIRRKNRFWALKNVSFSVKEGEVLGVIGRNGAGKSTLLKILARIVPPTTGRVDIYGRTASILEVGTGFNSELTGRENVFLSGAILGMKKREMEEKFDKIVEFSDIGKFIDMPVKRYSSGMHVRLAFAVVAHLDPKILIIDEVLAVGDIAFQRKSLKKMHSMAKNEGRTVLFVSHNMGAVNSLCDRTVLLEEGKVVAVGKTKDIISEYMSDYVPEEESSEMDKNKIKVGDKKIGIDDFWIEDRNNKRTTFIKSGDRCSFVFKYLFSDRKMKKNVDVGFSVVNSIGQPLFSHYMSNTKQGLKNCPNKGRFVFEFDKLPLIKDKYDLSFKVTVDKKEIGCHPNTFNFNVENGDFYETGVVNKQSHLPFYINGSWQLKK